MANLFQTTLSANGQAPSSSGQAYAGRDVSISISGTFGSGTATIQTKKSGDSNWVDVETGYTTATVKIITLADGEAFRVNLAGATSPTVVVTASLVDVRS